MGRLKIPKFGKIIISHSAQGAIYPRTRAPYLWSFETFLAFIPMLQLIYDLLRCALRTVPSVEWEDVAVGSEEPLQKSPLLDSFIDVTPPEKSFPLLF